MKRYQGSLFGLAALVLVAACAQQETAEVKEDAAPKVEKVDKAALEAAMDAIEADYIAAYNTGDAGGIAALFADDGYQSPPLMPRLDKAGVEAMYLAQFEAVEAQQLEVMREGYVADGKHVVSWGGFRVVMTPTGGEPVEATGRYGVVNRQEPDGTWKIVGHMFNYEVPPPGFGQM
jgi:ketosteroid isomerase-like protein